MFIFRSQAHYWFLKGPVGYLILLGAERFLVQFDWVIRICFAFAPFAQPWPARTRFPALHARYMYLFWDLIGYLWCLRLLWLVLVLRRNNLSGQPQRTQATPMCQFRNEGKSEFRNERKRARSRYDWPGFYFCSVEKVAWGFLTNHRANPIENRSVDTMCLFWLTISCLVARLRS